MKIRAFPFLEVVTISYQEKVIRTILLSAWLSECKY